MADVFFAGEQLLQKISKVSADPNEVVVKNTHDTQVVQDTSNCREVIEEEIIEIVEEDYARLTEAHCPNIDEKYRMCYNEQRVAFSEIPPIAEIMCEKKDVYVQCVADKAEACKIWADWEKNKCGPFSHTEMISINQRLLDCEVTCNYGTYEETLSDDHAEGCVADLKGRLEEIRSTFKGKLEEYRSQKLRCRYTMENCTQRSCDPEPPRTACTEVEQRKKDMCDNFDVCWEDAEKIQARLQEDYEKQWAASNRDWVGIQELICKLKYFKRESGTGDTRKADREQCVADIDHEHFKLKACPQNKKLPCRTGHPAACRTTEIKDYPCVHPEGQLQSIAESLEPTTGFIQVSKPCPSGKCSKQQMKGSIL